MLKIKNLGGLQIVEPAIVWDTYSDDLLIDLDYENETHALEEAAQREADDAAEKARMAAAAKAAKGSNGGSAPGATAPPPA